MKANRWTIWLCGFLTGATTVAFSALVSLGIKGIEGLCFPMLVAMLVAIGVSTFVLLKAGRQRPGGG